MNPDAYDDPHLEEKWLNSQRGHIKSYLEKQKILHGGLLDEPSWFVAPYVCLWKAKGMEGGNGYWIISGGLPTDYIEESEARNPRFAMESFALRWQEISRCLIAGIDHPTIKIGKDLPVNEKILLGELLNDRATLLLNWVYGDDI